MLDNINIGDYFQDEFPIYKKTFIIFKKICEDLLKYEPSNQGIKDLKYYLSNNELYNKLKDILENTPLKKDEINKYEDYVVEFNKETTDKDKIKNYEILINNVMKEINKIYII